MLGGVPAEAGGHPEGPGLAPQPLHQGGDAVGAVVVGRPATEGEPPGHGEGPGGVVDGQSQLAGGDADHAGEARVEVDRRQVVGARSGQGHRPLPGQADRRGAVELGPIGDEPVVVGVGARQREHPTVLGHPGGPGPLRRAADVGGPLVHREVRRAQLAVGEGDHAVVRGGPGDLLGAVRRADPGVGVGRRHRAELRPELADAAPGARRASSRPRLARRSRTTGRRGWGGGSRGTVRGRWPGRARCRRGPGPARRRSGPPRRGWSPPAGPAGARRRPRPRSPAPRRARRGRWPGRCGGRAPAARCRRWP